MGMSRCLVISDDTDFFFLFLLLSQWCNILDWHGIDVLAFTLRFLYVWKIPLMLLLNDHRHYSVSYLGCNMDRIYGLVIACGFYYE